MVKGTTSSNNQRTGGQMNWMSIIKIMVPIEKTKNRFLNEKYMDELGLDERVMTFIKEVLKEQKKRLWEINCNVEETWDRRMKEQEKRLRLNEKELDEILKKFYEHMCGVDDYGCDLCLKYKQEILDLQGEK